MSDDDTRWTGVILTEDLGRDLKIFLREMNKYTDMRWEVWDMKNGILVPSKEPKIARTLYLPMINPSARTRKHESALQYGDLVLEWLDAHGAHVLGSPRCLKLSCSKTLQTMAFIKAGFPQPPSVTVCDSTFSTRAARKMLGFVESVNDPRFSKDPHSKHEGFLKPDVGSGGMFVKRFRDCSELRRISEARPVVEAPLRGAPAEMYVLQRAVPGCTAVHRSGAGGFKIVRLFYRFEFVDRDLVYCLRAVANDDARSLCPCEESSTTGVEWAVVKNPRRVFGEAEWTSFLGSCAKLTKNEKRLRTFTIKGLHDIDRAKIVPIGIDCCDCPRYNIDLEASAGVTSGYRAYAQWILSEVRKR
jgi:hypothetical protein